MSKASTGRREIEVKFRLGPDLPREQAVERLMVAGFAERSAQDEFDFVPDTAGYLCRANKMMVRFRRVTVGGDERILLTFKSRRSHERFLDAEETEFYLDMPDLEAWEHINRALEGTVGVRLPESMLGVKNYVQAIALAADSGLDWFRMMIEKKRTTYVRGMVVATIDELPSGMGEFLEIEAHTEESIHEVVAALGLELDQAQKVDYGDIVMAHNGSRDARGRTAAFDEQTRDEIYALMKGVA